MWYWKTFLNFDFPCIFRLWPLCIYSRNDNGEGWGTFKSSTMAYAFAFKLERESIIRQSCDVIWEQTRLCVSIFFHQFQPKLAFFFYLLKSSRQIHNTTPIFIQTPLSLIIQRLINICLIYRLLVLWETGLIDYWRKRDTGSAKLAAR